MTHPPRTITTSAPGSMMLMGEHAVLRGRPALCMAVRERVDCLFTPRTDREVTVSSSLGELTGTLEDLPESDALRFVREAIRTVRPRTGFHLRIDSRIDPTRGLGSSAAVTAAVVTGLRAMRNEPFDRAAILSHTLNTIRAVQGTGSGSDAAASAYGGIVKIDPDPFQIEPLQARFDFAAGYAGYKTPTPDVIRKVEAMRREDPEVYERVFDAMAACVDAAVVAIRNGDADHLGGLMNLHHGLQNAIGTGDAALDALANGFRSVTGVTGAKTSGSGLGDCVLALGNPGASVENFVCFPVELDEKGVTLAD